MNRATYIETHDVPYIGKHEKKLYEVYRVIGPAGPEETIRVYGLDEAKMETYGCWDYEITRVSDGKVMNV